MRSHINSKLGKKAEAEADIEAAKKLAAQPVTDCDSIMRSIDSAFDMRRCNLYNALAGYSLYRQAETSGYNARELNEALHAIDDAIRCNASPADFYRIKSMILVKLHKDDLAKENDAVFADKQRQNEEPQVNDEVRSIK